MLRDYVNRDQKVIDNPSNKIEKFLKVSVFGLSIAILIVVVLLFISSSAKANQKESFTDLSLSELCHAIGYSQASANSVSSFEFALYNEMYMRSPLSLQDELTCSSGNSEGKKKYKEDYS